MTFLEYVKYIKFACDEELERLGEFLYSVEEDYDCTGDKYYIEYPHSNCPPDKEQAEQWLAGRNMAADFAVIDGPDCTAKDDLYSELRQILLYS